MRCDAAAAGGAGVQQAMAGWGGEGRGERRQSPDSGKEREGGREQGETCLTQRREKSRGCEGVRARMDR